MQIKKEYIDSFLTDLERVKLTEFESDIVMKESVKKFLLAGLYFNGTLKKGVPASPSTNFALGLVASYEGLKELSDEEAGARLRAAWEGIKILENGFNELSKYKIEEERSSKENPAV